MLRPEVQSIADDIRSMKIRGAGHIARASVRGLMITAAKSGAASREEFMAEMEAASKSLIATRPTAVSLPNGVRFIIYRLTGAASSGASLQGLKESVTQSGEAFIKRSLEAVKKIADYGARRIEDRDVIITHCHSSAVVALLKEAARQGKSIKVYSTETRPRYQGRITASQLAEAGIPVTLIVDSAARYFMRKADKVLIGADAVAANGAVVNKIGTSQVALAAHEARVYVFVAAETYKFHPETMVGKLVEIEERPSTEVVDKSFLESHPGVKVRNPSFDVTPSEYIDLIITERGIIPPQAAVLLLREEFGWLPSEGEALPLEGEF